MLMLKMNSQIKIIYVISEENQFEFKIKKNEVMEGFLRFGSNLEKNSYVKKSYVPLRPRLFYSYFSRGRTGHSF